MLFKRRKSFLKPILLKTTPELPDLRPSIKDTDPTLTRRDFQILFVASITNISVIDL